MPSPRDYCFTLNNPTDEEITNLKDEWATLGFSYICFSTEQGDNGTPHLQGFLRYRDRIGKSKLRGLLGGRAHVEPRAGTPDQARDYCRKDNAESDGRFWESGDWNGGKRQGHRTDADAIGDLIKGGASESDIFDAFPGGFLRLHAGIKRARYVVETDRQEAPDVYWYWGGTGIGKSTAAQAHSANRRTYWAPPCMQWWDRYDGHELVIIDEFRGQIQFNTLLRMLDRFPLDLPVKGGFCRFKPKLVVITSPFHPRDVYFKDVKDDDADKFERAQGSIEQLLRRLTSIMTRGSWQDPWVDEKQFQGSSS